AGGALPSACSITSIGPASRFSAHASVSPSRGSSTSRATGAAAGPLAAPDAGSAHTTAASIAATAADGARMDNGSGHAGLVQPQRADHFGQVEGADGAVVVHRVERAAGEALAGLQRQRDAVGIGGDRAAEAAARLQA